MPEEHSNTTGRTPDGPEPIIAAIAAYRTGMAAYAEAKDESDECVERTYGPPLDVIIGWTEPARTQECATEALRLAVQEIEAGFVTSALPMVRAALSFLEGAA